METADLVLLHACIEGKPPASIVITNSIISRIITHDIQAQKLCLDSPLEDIKKWANEHRIPIDAHTRFIDCHHWIALPGLVDTHTHLREPSNEGAETVETGSQAGAAGGYTCVHAMANTTPVTDTAERVTSTLKAGNKAGWLQVRPIGAVTKNLANRELADLEAMAYSPAAVRMFSDDGKCVSNSLLMRRALEIVRCFDGVIAQHAQDPLLTACSQMNEGKISRLLGLEGWPSAAEESIIARDIIFAHHFHSRLHVCHLSTRGSVEILRIAKNEGIDVTAEVTPHHLILTDEKARTGDAVFKVNPPLRTREDTEALQQGLEDGVIDCIGTDHAPHIPRQKICEWTKAVCGMTGLETALPILIDTMVASNRLSWHQLASVMSYHSAHIGRVKEQGKTLDEGHPAHICVVDPQAYTHVSGARHYSHADNTPFEKMTFRGRVMMTIFRGRLTFYRGNLVPDSKLLKKNTSLFLSEGRLDDSSFSK